MTIEQGVSTDKPQTAWWTSIGWAKAAAILSLLGILGIWELYVRISGTSVFILPAPSRIAEAALRLGPLLFEHTWVTTVEILIGFVIGNLLAILIAYLIVLWPLVERVTYPALIMSQTIPKIAIAPLLVIWFGTGLLPKVIIVVLMCFFPTAVNLIEGIKTTQREAIDLVRIVTSSRHTIFAKVQFPASLPYLFAGLKISMTAAVIGAIVGEWIGATQGLGYLILYGGQSMRTDLTFVGVVAAVLLGMVLYAAVGLAERLFSWRADDPME